MLSALHDVIGLMKIKEIDKLYCYKRGIFNTTKSRNPILPFDTCHKQIADEIIDDLISIEEDL